MFNNIKSAYNHDRLYYYITIRSNLPKYNTNCILSIANKLNNITLIDISKLNNIVNMSFNELLIQTYTILDDKYHNTTDDLSHVYKYIDETLQQKILIPQLRHEQSDHVFTLCIFTLFVHL